MKKFKNFMFYTRNARKLWGKAFDNLQKATSAKK